MLTRTFTISLAILSLTAARELASRAAPAATGTAIVALPRPAHFPADLATHHASIADIDGCREEAAPAPRAQVTAASSCGEPGSVGQ